MEEIIEREISVDEYIAGFRNAEACMEACRECPNFGRTWACPPFDFDVMERISRYRRLRLVACTARLADGTDFGSFDTIRPLRDKMDRRILEIERACGDALACAFGGYCRRCSSCARPQGLPCRHPEAVRPALEAYGFDVCRTLDKLFGITLEWTSPGHTPTRLTLLGGVFYNP